MSTSTQTGLTTTAADMPAGRGANPGDIPVSRPRALDRYDALIGTWDMEVSFPAGYFAPKTPPITNRTGRTTFEWLEGRFFLLQRFVNEHPAAPSGIAIIGPSTEGEPFSQHYYDSRGVARIYRTSLEGRVWKVWREAPDFYQRYTGTISKDGSRIAGAWEGSTDGSDWKHDFDLAYIRASGK